MAATTKISEISHDIRQLYTFTIPAVELQDFIEFYSETSLAATTRSILTDKFTVSLFPSFTPTIWINLGSPYELLNGNKIQRVDKNQDVLVLRSTIIERNNFATDNIFTIKFNPLGFEAIFGQSQSLIGDDIIPASNILPAFVIRKLRESISFEEKTLFLDSYFLEKIHRKREDSYHLTCIKTSIDYFLKLNMISSVSEMAAHVHVSEKTFNRHFHRIIGTNPKDFFFTMRCRASLSHYKKNPRQFSPLDFGYYDSSHFSKDVRRFTGTNLTSFLQA